MSQVAFIIIIDADALVPNMWQAMGYHHANLSHMI